MKEICVLSTKGYNKIELLLLFFSIFLQNIERFIRFYFSTVIINDYGRFL